MNIQHGIRLILVGCLLVACAPLDDRLVLQQTAFDQLPGWHHDQHEDALGAFARSCTKLQALPDDKPIHQTLAQPANSFSNSILYLTVWLTMMIEMGCLPVIMKHIFAVVWCQLINTPTRYMPSQIVI